MKNLKVSIQGGGVFSRLLQCAIVPLADIEYDNLYLTVNPFQLDVRNEKFFWMIRAFEQQMLEMQKYGIDEPYDRLFNYIIDQQSDYSYVDIGPLDIGTMFTKENKIEHSPKFKSFKKVANSIRFKRHIVKQAEAIFDDIDPSEALAVHLRIKDVGGHNYDHFSFDDYVTAIGTELNNFNYKKIFVAADNLVSLRKIQEIFPGMVIHHEFDRSSVEDNDYANWEFHNFFKKHYWETALTDCLSLSKCRNLICRTSNFSNAAIVFGQFGEIIRL